eukprot:761430-Hanusia_phi.AAC.2
MPRPRRDTRSRDASRAATALPPVTRRVSSSKKKQQQQASKQASKQLEVETVRRLKGMWVGLRQLSPVYDGGAVYGLGGVCIATLLEFIYELGGRQDNLEQH